ncbi:hypothetical protein ETB97_002157 [Aspergillus alliaceus]|uniref:Uncharacterized protein n=1 Tax=Petromyces alliaceus TaxID=209559 RepID=A0A5N7CEK8_PETAA|nr:hypothetical protein BDV23DRAFT_181526 [Aspergillus alliaceus]KAF5859960.1 hypothetical protein ETB97_002157 [Aspergillus burnettii]
MRFSFLAAFTLITAALAAPQQQGGGSVQKTIPIGAPCKKDGTMGVCDGGFCLQDEKADQGVCKAQN